jgi:NAD(P)-dependent dehydrogenase (short-subunit alcohol dehydrogenase family)
MAAVHITTVRDANAGLLSQNTSRVALFIGATNGIGSSALWSFIRHFYAPRVYVVGRFKAKASPLLDGLAALNSNATITFIEKEISLLQNVKSVCEEIKQREKSLDLLYMSAGYLAFGEPQCLSARPISYICLSAHMRV